jgi:hypothetical protein
LSVNDTFSVLMYEWFSSDGLEGRAEARVRTPTNRYFPFTTVMTFIIEAGFNYYLAKLYNQTETAGGVVIVVQSPYGDDTNDFNRAFGAGQTFKLQITGSSSVDDYIPKDYIFADIGITSSQKLGGVRSGRGVAINPTTGELSSTPVSIDLINSMNTTQFENTNSVINIKTSWKPTTAGTADNVAWSGVSSVPTTWSDSQIPTLAISKTTGLQGTLDGKAPSSHTHPISDITNLQTTLDGKAPTSHTHTIANITNLQTTLDGKAPTSHTHPISDITSLQTTLDAKAPTSHTHTIANITNLQTTLDGKTPTSHTHPISDITSLQTTLDGKGPTSQLTQ